METEDALKKIHDYSLEDIMGDRFGRYSKYIIQDRAIPDVRDGLKPVQRRILYAMFKDKNTHDHQFKKSAKAVGNVIGNYHPHGDSSVYEALVRMSQNFKLNHPYVQMDGNNGSIDGDPAAAMRYTEASLSKIAMELLKDIDKNTVIFSPNYDDTTEEPTVLPARFPNLLVNGTTGISAGYATNIPPHNLGEIIDATIKRIDSPNCRLDTILEIVKGPDFPTGGIVEGKEGIVDAYTAGKGKIIVRSRFEVTKVKGKSQIIITEIPYEVNKALLIKKIDEIRIDKQIDGISEIRDESDKRDNLRIAIDLKNDADTKLIINYLLKNTELQVSYNFNMVTIVNRRPKLLGIIPILDAYIAHQKEIIKKRSEFDLAFALNKIHITEGLIKAISILDEVIALIRASKNKQDAIINLVEKYQFSEKQAEAIVMLQLYRLTNTDVTILLQELEDLRKVISMLQEILGSEDKLNTVIKEELRKIRNEYAYPRKTDIEALITEIKIDVKDMIGKEEVITVLTSEGYLKRVSLKSYNSSPNEETGLKSGDYVINLYRTNTLDTLVVFTSMGNYLYIPIHLIPEGKWKDLGKHISNIVTINPEEKIISAYIYNNETANNEVIIMSKNGQVMRTTLKNFEVTRYSKAMTVMKLKENDAIINTVINFGQVLMVSNDGYYTMFNAEEIPLVNIRSTGVKGLNVKNNEVISGLSFNKTNEFINIFTNKKTAKRIKIIDLAETGRAKRGNSLIKKVKSVNYELIKVTNSESRDMVGLKKDEDIKFIKNSEIPIMDLESTGSSISSVIFNDAFIYASLVKFKESLVNDEQKPEEIKTETEIKIKEMTIDDFLEDFKL